MSVTFYIAGYLSAFADGQSTIELGYTPQTVGEALDELWNRHIGLRDRVLTELGDVRPHVNIFVGSHSIGRKSGLSTTLQEGTEIFILPAVSGG